jgi:hypothetical protein
VAYLSTHSYETEKDAVAAARGSVHRLAEVLDNRGWVRQAAVHGTDRGVRYGPPKDSLFGDSYRAQRHREAFSLHKAFSGIGVAETTASTWKRPTSRKRR